MGVRIVTNENFPKIKELCSAIVEHGIPEYAEVIYNGRRNQIYKFKYGNRWITVKSFKIPNLINSIAYSTFRMSKAKRSYLYAKKLLQLGLLSPTPLAYIEERKRGRLKHSYYICDFIEGETVRNWEQRTDRDAMLQAMAEDLKKMHNLGVWHKDYSPGNIICNGNEKEGYTFQYIDINRMQFGVFDRERLMHCFSCIHLDEKETRRFAHYYALACGLDIKETEDRALKELAHYKKRKGSQDTFKRIFKIGKYNPKLQIKK